MSFDILFQITIKDKNLNFEISYTVKDTNDNYTFYFICFDLNFRISGGRTNC